MALYRIEWVSESKVVAAAKRRGMKPDDGTSFWDWCEPENFTDSVTRKTFSGAIKAARQALPHDCFGEVVIARCVAVKRSYGPIELEDREHWHVQADGPDPVEGEPDYRTDPELSGDDEEIG